MPSPDPSFDDTRTLWLAREVARLSLR